jgi:S-adenosylmethionine-diacylglycerol 3-amino-3-carboxypropyl transferase
VFVSGDRGLASFPSCSRPQTLFAHLLKFVAMKKVFEWVSRRVFSAVHGNNLVYNICWEDPRLDRVALEFKPDDHVLVITSAGCNALDYSLCGPQHVHAVDMNPRQNALLELKQAAIRTLDYATFFKMFGHGQLDGVAAVYEKHLRSQLSGWSQRFWDKRIKWFDHPTLSFYFRGTSGSFARLINHYIDHVAKVRPAINELLAAESLEQQSEIYLQRIYPKFWSRPLKFFINRDVTMAMLGVPKAQRRQLETQYNGHIAKFIHDSLESVLTKVPIHDNYFWRVYLTGRYTPDCCPEYLKEANFETFRNGVIDRVTTHTDSVQGFLEKHPGRISKFILLDHMDWLSDNMFPLLESEWQAIVDKAAPNARLIWRSGGLQTDFIDRVEVEVAGKSRPVPELLHYHSELAAQLHPQDRVHTYGSFFIADLKMPS